MHRFALVSIVALALASPLLAADPSPRPGEEFIDAVRGGSVQPAKPAPPRAPGEGVGPFGRLVIRGATLVDGTGAPPVGPVDVVVEGGRIRSIQGVGYPGVPIREAGRPAKGDHELDAHGMYLLPGFVDAHTHIAYPSQGALGETPSAEYVYKLWLAHGVTTAREVGSGNGLAWTVSEAKRSAANEIAAPRIVPYPFFPVGIETPGAPQTPAEARKWVDAVAAAGAQGIKFLGAPPEVMKAALARAAELGLETTCHHAQLAVTRMNVLDTSSWGLDSMEHWYGLPEALFTDRTIQEYPSGYDYNDESHRFGQAGRLWEQAAAPGSARWNEVLQTLRARDFTLVPTLTIYEASRDLMRERRAEWHDDYTLPTLWRWFQPNREAHGSYWFDWTTADEIAWKRNYQRWMQFLDDYKNLGGRVAVGSDSGFIYKLFGFGYVRELELLQEAGFHPLEVVRAATLDGAELLGLDAELGSIEPGKRADFVLVAENPLANFKVLYGTGHFKLDDSTGQPIHTKGIRYTIKDGIVYDAQQLLADVRRMVAEAKEREKAAAQP